MKKNGNWVEKKDGFHKAVHSVTKGNAVYFAQTPPPMRNQAGVPMKNYDEIDFGKLIQEVNEGKWQPR